MKKQLVIFGIVAIFVCVGLSGCISENKPPIVTISAEPITGFQPLHVSFTIDASDEDGTVESYRTEFGDGNISYETTPTHMYSAGTYLVTVTVTDDKGAETSDTITIIVENIVPTASAYASVITGKAPLTVPFSGSGNDSDGTIVSYNWNFGDGETSSEQNPTHVFQNSGNYTVTLEVTDNSGGTATDTVLIISSDNEPPKASTHADVTGGMGPLTVHFTGSGTDSDGYIVSYHWEFTDASNPLGNDDVSTSDQQNPTHTFHYYNPTSFIGLDRGFDAVLTVTDDKGATATDSIHITMTGIKMTVLSADDWHYGNIKVNIKVEVSFDYDVGGCYYLESEGGLQYKTCTVSASIPTKMTEGSSATWSVYFDNLPDNEYAKILWNYQYTDYQLTATLP